MNEKSFKEFGESPIDEIREKADLVLVVGKDTQLQRRGNKYVAFHCCPFCSTGDSFTVDPKKQLFHCFGCGAGGDIFTYVMKKKELSFLEAVRFLAGEFNVDLKEKWKEPEAIDVQDQRTLLDNIENIISQLKNIVDSYEFKHSELAHKKEEEEANPF